MRNLQSLIFPRTKEKSFPIILASLRSMIPEHRKSRTFCDSRRKIIYCVRNIRQSNYSCVIGHRGRWGLWSIRCRFLSSGNCLRHLKAYGYRKPKVWATAWKKPRLGNGECPLQSCLLPLISLPAISKWTKPHQHFPPGWNTTDIFFRAFHWLKFKCVNLG